MGNPVAALSEYDLRHLAAHLDESGRADDLPRLLALETSERRNAWYEARDAIGESAGFLSDIVRAWRLTDDVSLRHETATVVSLQCRYASIVASVNSLTKNIPPRMLEMLVVTGRWTYQQALATVQQNTDLRSRAGMLKALAPFLSESERMNELYLIRDESRQIPQDRIIYVEVLAALASLLPETERLTELREALDSLVLMPEWDQAMALELLAPELPALLLREALTDVRADLRIPFYQNGKTLATLALFLAARGDLKEAIETVWTVEDKEFLVQALVVLIPYLPETLLRQTLYKASTHNDAWCRVRMLVEIAPHLPKSERMKLLQQALQETRKFDDVLVRASLLAKIGPQLPVRKRRDVLQAALDAARTFEQWHADREEAQRVEILVLLSTYLPGPLLREALMSAHKILDERMRMASFATIIPYLPDPERPAVLHDSIRAGEAYWYKGFMTPELEQLSPYLTRELQREVLSIVRRMIKNEHTMVEVMEVLIPHLDQSLIREALIAARALRDRHLAARMLTRLATLLPEQEQLAVLDEALSATRTINDQGERAKALAELALKAPVDDQTSILHAAIAIARAIEDGSERAMILAKLTEQFPLLPIEAQLPILRAVLAGVREIDDTYWRAWTLSSLIPHLPEAEQLAPLQETLSLARSLSENRIGKARLLLSLGPLAPKKERLSALRNAFKEIMQMSASNQVELFSDFAPYLPTVLLREALEAVWVLDEPVRVEMQDPPLGELLEVLVPYLPAVLLPEALDRAGDLEDEPSRNEAIALLAPRLAETGNHLKALRVVRAIEDEYWQVFALAKLVSTLPQHEQLMLQREVLIKLRSMHSDPRISRVLVALTPNLPTILLDEALEAAEALDEVKPRIVALAPLLPLIPEEKRIALLGATWEAVRERRQIQEFITLAPLLPPVFLIEAIDVIRKDEYYLQQTTKALALPLAQLPLTTLHSYLREVLHVVARHSRTDFLGDLIALAPILVVLGGAPAITMITDTIQDISRWWP